VALKVPIASNDPVCGQTFTSIAHELRMFRRLRHPNIVLCYGACIVPKSCEVLLVLEYVRGTRLGVFIAPPPSAPSTADRLQLVSGICCALRYLHSQKPSIVHGDIKCSNVLVEQRLTEVRAKLLDFGLSRLTTQHRLPTGGTLAWMAPEALLDRNYKPSPSSDVFSFGRLLYMIMTGLRPLRDQSESSMRVAAKAGKTHKADWPKEVPLGRDCKEWYEACCSAKPERRPSITMIQQRIGRCFDHPPWEEVGGRRLEEAVLEARASLRTAKQSRPAQPPPADAIHEESSWLSESVTFSVSRVSADPSEGEAVQPSLADSMSKQMRTDADNHNLTGPRPKISSRPVPTELAVGQPARAKTTGTISELMRTNADYPHLTGPRTKIGSQPVLTEPTESASAAADQPQAAGPTPGSASQPDPQAADVKPKKPMTHSL